MYLFYNVMGNHVYPIDIEWALTFYNEHIYLTESIWMVPGTVNPMEK